MFPAFGSAQSLREIEARLALAPDDVELRFARAWALDLLGQTSAARDAYIHVIERDGTHLGALGNLGTLLYNAGYRSAARLTYAEALKHHPRDIALLVNLGNALLEAQDLPGARKLYEDALAIDAACAPAHQGISHVFSRLGDDGTAERHRRAGFSAAPISVSAFRGEGLPVALLVLASTRRGNVPSDGPLDDRTFLTATLFTDYYDPTLPLPPHDVIFNSIGDADLCDASLVAAERLLTGTTASVINPPRRVRGTGRADMAQRLRGIDALIVPQIDRVRRDALAALDLRFPLLVRAPGFHTGELFEYVAQRADLERVVAAMPGEELFAIEFLNVRGPDGAYRKYRVLAIGGHLYPVHLARSSHWKVHYFSADLVRTAESQAEEAAFLADMPAAIGARAVAALEAIVERIGLDYFGIDFALDARGGVVFFEANATMRAVVPAPDDPNHPRRSAAVTANAALRELVLGAARRGSSSG
jgi:hypothetical protein